MDVNHDHVADSLRELADEREQRRLWLSDGSGGRGVSSFDECVCHLFLDSGLGDALERPGMVYTQPIDDRLTMLRLALHRIESHRAPSALLDDPALDEVRASATEILRLLNELPYRKAST
jgi:hypothetical protein